MIASEVPGIPGIWVIPELPPSAIRAVALYGPIVLVAVLGRAVRPTRREVAGALLATAWNVAFLLVANVVAVRLGWWHFAADGPDMAGRRSMADEPSLDDGPSVAGVPVELWLGWALLWGAAPILVTARRHYGAAVAGAVATLVALDLFAMPLPDPVVVLAPSWLVGEAFSVAICLVPGLLLGGWTARGERLVPRIALQVVAFTALVFYVAPSALFAAAGVHDGWRTLLDRPRWQLLGAALVVSPVVGMALQAVAEFAAHGGTPVPLDPPTRLVTTGPYAYIGNPMQLAGVVLLVAWGVVLGSVLVVGSAVVSAVFSAGLAAWSENGELGARFGEDWHRYRRRVRFWRPSWRPAVVAPGSVYVAEGCEPCAEVGRFLGRRPATGLDIRPADLCPLPLQRITYERAGGRDTGIAAIGRSLEHVNLAWAAASWIARLPGVVQLLQLISDVVIGTPGATPGTGDAPRHPVRR